MYRIALLFMLLLPAASCLAQKKEAPIHWEESLNSLRLYQKGKLLWGFNYDGIQKPHFHPLCTADGTVLTEVAPADHLWHLGLWFSWKYIAGVNYWEYLSKETILSEGITQLKRVAIGKRASGAAEILLQLVYAPKDSPNQVVLKEKRTISISAPTADGSYFIDQVSVFTAREELLLDRTPIPGEVNGQSWGGYGGLFFRMNPQLAPPEYLTPIPREHLRGDRFPWMALSTTGISGQIVGLAIFDHPDNPRFPAPWYIMEDAANHAYGFGPALLYQGPYKLEAGKKLELRYRIYIYTGSLSKAEIEQLYGEYIY